VAPSRSATGHALLAADPHLALALPSVWYEAHLVAPGVDVAGVTIPGMPAVIIGHNRRIAWGMTVLMTDSGDFFLERLDPGPPLRAMSQGRWVNVTERKETIRVRGAPAVELVVRSTPHGPLVGELLSGEKEALSYRWAPTAAQDANDIEAFYRMDRAGSWPEFRGALSLLGAVAMNVTFADRDGHIGLQTVGRVPIRKGDPAGLRIRKGWDGSEDWAGFVPFERMPNSYDPPTGWLATSNNQPLDRLTPFYLASRYEPRDRFLRLKERLTAETHWTPEALGALQSDVQWVTGRAWAPRVAPACAADSGTRRVPLTELERRALTLLNGWDGTMGEDSGAAAVFAETYRQFFRETFADKLDPALLTAIEDIPNLHGQFLRIAFEEDPSWFDRAATPERESADAILCASFRKAAGILASALGDRPEAWRWGTHHRLTLDHALSRSKVLAPYFSRGPYPRLGHNQTVNKQQAPGMENGVRVGASTRQVVDLGDPAHALAVIPGGQSGIPASPHYDDQTPLWLSGRYHPMLMERADIERHLEEKLQLMPERPIARSSGSRPAGAGQSSGAQP
jgi:penicillin amidase